MSLTPGWQPSHHQEEAAVAAESKARTRALLASHRTHDHQLEEYAMDLRWWQERHESAMEQLVRINRAAVEALAREEKLVRETRVRLQNETEELRARMKGMKVFDGEEEEVLDTPAVPSLPLRDLVPRHSRDSDLVNASSKVRRANKLAMEAINRDDTGVLVTLLAPNHTRKRLRKSLPSPPPIFPSLRSRTEDQSTNLKPEQLISMTSDIREAVLAGKVYAIQTRSLSGEEETIRCGRIILSRGALHLHCLIEGPPPPGSLTIEHKKVLNEIIDRECTLAFLDLENTSPELKGRVYIRLSPSTGRARQFTWLCTGQKGVNYTNTSILSVLDKGGTRERIVGGDYEGLNGAGGASIIPWLGWGRQYRREWQAGVVRGWWGGMHRAAQFFITTQNGNPGETVHFAFGQVEYGLEVVKAVAKLPNPTEAKVVDCGVVAVEEV